ncbi:MAG: hypothetical protein ACO4AU_09595 [bacterium]
MESNPHFDDRYDRLISMSERLISISEHLVQQHSRDQEERQEMLELVRNLEHLHSPKPSASPRPEREPALEDSLPSGAEFLRESPRPRLSRLFLQGG